MFSTRATLEKMDQEEIISLFLKSHEKLFERIIQLTNQVCELAKTLSRMENQQASYNNSNEVFDKRITSNDIARKFHHILYTWGYLINSN